MGVQVPLRAPINKRLILIFLSKIERSNLFWLFASTVMHGDVPLGVEKQMSRGQTGVKARRSRARLRGH